MMQGSGGGRHRGPIDKLPPMNLLSMLGALYRRVDVWFPCTEETSRAMLKSGHNRR